MSGIDSNNEDEDYQFEARKPLELEVERNILGLTCILSDHSEEFIFRRNERRHDSGTFLYHCRLCSVQNMHGERCLLTHIAGRKHQAKYAQPIIDVALFRGPKVGPKPLIDMDIAPGEPVPPGFEDEVKPISSLQKTLDACKNQALVALEYIVELVRGPGRESQYHCTLCDKRGDPRTIMFHLTSYNHRLKFLEKHFPTIQKELHVYRSMSNNRELMTRIMQSVCETIEEKLGRLAPSVRNFEGYDKLMVTHLINAEKHLDEKCGSTFVDTIDHKTIQSVIDGENSTFGLSKCTLESMPLKTIPKHVEVDTAPAKRAERNSLDSISSLSDSEMSLKVKPEPHIVGTVDLRSPSGSLSPISDTEKIPDTPRRIEDPPRRIEDPPRRIEDPPRRIEEPRQTLPTPKQLAIQSTEITKERYTWEKYRCLVKLAIEELDRKNKEHEKIPEIHPRYTQEWKKFWGRRYKELEMENKDPATHNFKQDWIEFWPDRLKELYAEDVERKKSEIRKRLKLPQEGTERDIRQQYALKINVKSTSLDSRIRRGPSPKRGRRTPPRRRSRSRSRSPRRRSRSPRRRNASPPRRRSSHSRSPLRRPTGRVIHRERSTERKVFSPLSDDSSDSRKRSVRSRSPQRKTSQPPAPNYPSSSDYYGAVRPPNYDDWGHPMYYAPPQPPYYYHENEQASTLLEAEETEPVNVVSVLRLLTALEDLLGSLGPKVIDLLAKALALEKIKANSADDMLINDDTCVVFETIKEKLKGQLIANVVEKHKIAAVKRAVKNVAIVIHEVTERAKKAAKEAKPSIIASTPVVAPPPPDLSNSEASENAAIAAKIAQALKVQGKTDLTSEQLEELIVVYKAMHAKAKETKQIVTTANYLSSTTDATVVEPTVTIKIEDSPEEVPSESSPNILESLTDSDLETLLQNFQDLSADEQQHLIAYLKKLELSQPLRVEKLRKFVNLDVRRHTDDKSSDDEMKGESSAQTDKIMYPSKSVLLRNQSATALASHSDDTEPNSSKSNFRKPTSSSQVIQQHIIESDDDDDYSFDDVFKAASKNVKEKQLEDHMKVVHSSLQFKDREEEFSSASQTSTNTTDGSAGSGLTLADTQNMIDNLMGSLHKNVRQNKIPVVKNDRSTTNPPHRGGPNRLPSSRQEPAVNHDEMDLEPPVPVNQTGKIPFYQQQQQVQQTSYYPQPNKNASGSGSGTMGHVAYPMVSTSYMQTVQYPGFGGNTQGYQQHQQPQHPGFQPPQRPQPFQDQHQQRTMQQEPQPFGQHKQQQQNQHPMVQIHQFQGRQMMPQQQQHPNQRGQPPQHQRYNNNPFNHNQNYY